MSRPSRLTGRHGRVGHLFQGRYKGILVEKESYLLELARYIVLTPVRAGMVRYAEDWPWSGYRASAAIAAPPPGLATDVLLWAFADSRRKAIAENRRFIADGFTAPSPWQDLRNQIFLSSEQFVERMQAKIDPTRPLQEIPQRPRQPIAKPLAHDAERWSGRDQAIVAAGPNWCVQQASDRRILRRQPYDRQLGRQTI